MTFLKRVCALMLSLCVVALPVGSAPSYPLSSVSEDKTSGLSYKVSGISSSARAAVLMDATDGERRILWESGARQRMGMASTTKIMTALVAIEAMPLSTPVTVTEESVGVEGSSVYLAKGETLSLYQLLTCVLLESANDAATAVAVAVGGSVANFAQMMNQKAESLGLLNTHFSNPHGLDDEEHYTTAEDLALITAEALDNDVFRSIVSTYRATVPSPKGERLLINHNRLLRSYEGCIGVKTGFTKSSGRCLVSAAERDGIRLIAVTLDDGADWVDHTAMLDAGFSALCSLELSRGGEIVASGENDSPGALYVDVIGGEQSRVMCRVSDDLRAILPKDHGAVTCRVEMELSLPAPIYRGDKTGKVTWYCDGVVIGSSDIICAFCAAKTPKKNFFRDLFG